MKQRLVLLVLLIMLVVWAGSERRLLALKLSTLVDGTDVAPLSATTDEGPYVRWVDDYFTIQIIAPNTFAIGEPRYSQQNYSYLIAGAERALMFDAGPGLRDIRTIAESLTDRPITFLPSHLHYDHVGNEIKFDRIALADLPQIRSRAMGSMFSPSNSQHLGFMEGFDNPNWEVDEWLAPGSEIDLGRRILKIYYTPGHTDDSVSLFDEKNNIVFSGDYLYPGPLYGFLPNSSMGQYMSSSVTLLNDLPEDVVFFGAHREAPQGAPTLGYGDLEDLHSALVRMKSGELEGDGRWPQTFVVNERLLMLAEPRWLQRWD